MDASPVSEPLCALGRPREFHARALFAAMVLALPLPAMTHLGPGVVPAFYHLRLAVWGFRHLHPFEVVFATAHLIAWLPLCWGLSRLGGSLVFKLGTPSARSAALGGVLLFLFLLSLAPIFRRPSQGNKYRQSAWTVSVG